MQKSHHGKYLWLFHHKTFAFCFSQWYFGMRKTMKKSFWSHYRFETKGRETSFSNKGKMGYFCVDISVVFSYQTAISCFVRVEAWKLMKIFFRFPSKIATKIYLTLHSLRNVLERSVEKGFLCNWIYLNEFSLLNWMANRFSTLLKLALERNTIMMMSKLME